MTYPLISVIIPNYNHAAFLHERIDSVLNQTYENIEVFILDDCSTDNSFEVIQQYINHPKVKQVIINEKNSGSTFKQWEKGFQLANGKYIWIAESDDVASLNFLQCLIEAVNGDEDVVLAFSKIQIIDELGKLGPIIGASRTREIRKKGGENFIKDSLFLGNHIYNASSVIFKKSSLTYIDQKYKSLRASGDYLFYIEIARTGKVLEVPVVLDFFRRHKSTVTPRLFASGEAFDNAYVIYKRLQEINIAKGLKRIVLVGFRLWQIDRSNGFNNKQIKDKLHNLWANEVTSISMAKLLFQLYRIYYFIYR